MSKYLDQYAEMLGISLVPVQYESLYPALSEKYGMYFEPIVSENGKTVVLADPDYQEQGRVLIYQKSEQGRYELLQIMAGNFFENEKGFGTAVDISADGSVIAVMSEAVTLVRHKKIQTLSNTVRIYTRSPIGQYLRRDHLFPHFIEEGSEYGEQMMLSRDGRMVFISAPAKENDATTIASGSTGAVYTYAFDAVTQTYKQHQLIRPPHGDIIRFGEAIGGTVDDGLYVVDESGTEYDYVFQELTETMSEFDSGWVFEKIATV